MAERKEALTVLLDAVRGGGWVAMSERTPQKGDTVLITYRYSEEEESLDVMEARWKGGYWEDTGEGRDLEIDVRAWMPLPPPYRPGTESGEEVSE
jgi:hypothetical protein